MDGKKTPGNSKIRAVLDNILCVMGFLFRHQFLLFLIILIVALTPSYIRFHKMGFTFFQKRKVIEVDNEHYQLAMEFWEDLKYDEAEKEFLISLKMEKETRSNSDLVVAAINQKLGALYLDMGKYEDGYECLNSAYVTFRDELGENDGNTIVAKAQIADYDLLMGNYEQAFSEFNDLYDQASGVSERMQICQMIAQSNMMLGNYSEALEWYKVLSNYYVGLAGTENQGAVNMVNDFGTLMTYMCEYETAIMSFNSAIVYWNSYAEKEDAVIANIYSNLARAYALNGNYNEAEEMADKSLEIYKKLYGDNNIYIAMQLDTVSQIYGVMQEFQREKEYLTEALEICKKEVGVNHSYTAVIYCDLGNYCFDIEDYEQAVSYYEQALEIRKNILGRNHPNTAVVCENLCNAYSRLGDYNTALMYGEESIETNEKLFGKDNPHTARAYLSIAWTYAYKGDLDNSVRYAEKGMDICKRHLDENDIGLAYAFQTMGYIKAEESDFDYGEQYLKEAIRRYALIEGKNHKDVAATERYLGELYSKKGDYDSAVEHYQNTCDIMKIVDDNNSSIAGVFHEMGFAAYQNEDYEKAIEFYNESIRRKEAEISVLNENFIKSSENSFKSLSATYSNIAAVYDALGDEDNMLRYCVAAYRILFDNGIDVEYNEKLNDRLHRLYDIYAQDISYEDWIDEQVQENIP